MTAMEAPWLDRNTMELWLKAPVEEIRSQDNSAKGENFLSNLKKLEVKTENGEVHSLIVKCQIEEGASADVFRASTVFRREKEMYGNTLEKMSQLLRETFPDSFEEFSAKSYYGCESFLVLEDLNASGFKMADRRVGLELEQCLLVMRTLARFHASSVILHQQNPGIFKEFDISVFSEESIEVFLEKVYPGFSRSLADEVYTWGKEWHKYAEKLRHLADVLKAGMYKVTRRQDSEFNVLIHGDLWTNNIMFKNKTDGIRFVDFQLTHFASPAIDLNYFLTSSINLEVRFKHKDRLVEEYHTTLCETLTALGYEQKLITLEELHREIDKKSVYGLFTLLGPYAVMQMHSDCGFSLDESLTTGSNPGSAMYGELYKEVVKFMLPIFDSKGAFNV